MRGHHVVGVVLVSLAAGWLLRGCAGEETLPTAPQPGAATRPVAIAAHPPERARPSAPERDGPPDPERIPVDVAPQPAPPPQTPPPVAESEPERGAPTDESVRSVSGIVVDSLSGAPVADVRILLCGPSGWHGDTTNAEGGFSCDMEPDWDVKRDRIEVRAGRDGYRTAHVPVATASVRVELERRTTPPGTGRVVGTALGEDGRPLTGRIFVCLRDDIDFRSPGIWTIADANGRFAIEGVEAGHWTVALSESGGTAVDVNVSEGGEAPVEVRADFGDGATGAFSGGELTEAAYRSQLARLQGMLRWAPDSKDAWQAVGWGEQQLGYHWLRYAPGRDVVVTGLRSDVNAFVRLDRREGGGCEWRAAIVDGVARFPSIPLGKWAAVLVPPGGDAESIDIDVKAGDGPLSVTMPAGK